MSDKFFPIPLKQLLALTLGELSSKDSYFGIPSELFYRPLPGDDNSLGSEVFGQYLATPVGVAAGPHTQMAQNIIGAWLMGARYVELKTIQTLDELRVPKPCIDMQDEGYNCEWSQELKIRQSFDEYLNAWIIIHVLNHHFGWPCETGTVFNMSVGYDLAGVRKDNVQWFLENMADCSEHLKARREEIREVYPAIDLVDIPVNISDNVTLSTMHGCPAGEIESIARYLMEDKGLHTYVKLNPTLLGPELLRQILNDQLGFSTRVPDQAFEHDLKYDDALHIIGNLRGVAERCGLDFGLKLTNTLEADNIREVFGSGVGQMYMSGRALHPLSVNLANRLQQEFAGELSLSFSAGADAFNVADALACGFRTVTVCSDLLKPGGYMRLHQYFGQMAQHPVLSKGFPVRQTTKEMLNRLATYAGEVLHNRAYKQEGIFEPDIKTSRELNLFDCISAPCRDACATHQDVPGYMQYASAGQFDKAMEVVLHTNSFPSVTGMVCDHLCQNKCTRVHYDHSLLIREVKRFISENGTAALSPEPSNGLKAAIVGAGPAGLSCAFYLALAGFGVDVYEAQGHAGGMVQYAIPGFRLTDEALEKDIDRIRSLGVRIHYSCRVDGQLFDQLRNSHDYLFIGAGAQLSAPLRIDGIDAKGVTDPLGFLKRIKMGEPAGIGQHVVIIGGGNTAMDAARTAYRVVGQNGTVTIVYRRTIREMPADQGEIRAVLEEGIRVIELSAPVEVITESGMVTALRCNRMELSEKDASGRRSPVKVEGALFDIVCDTIIPAVGQQTDIGFITAEMLKTEPGQHLTKLDRVFIGGDAMRGAATAIKAIGDGRLAAEEIMKQAVSDFQVKYPTREKQHNMKELMVKRAERLFPPDLPELPLSERKSFQLIQQTIDKENVVREANRCLYCDELCNTCVTVCPNFANYAYEVSPVVFQLQKIVRNSPGSDVLIQYDREFSVSQEVQILNIANFCNECGNCETFCPSDSAPYKVKPKLHLSIESFYGSEEGYYLSQLPGRDNLIWKHNGSLVTFSETPDAFFYETPDVMVEINKEDFSIREAGFLREEATESGLLQAANMMVIMQGAVSLTERLFL